MAADFTVTPIVSISQPTGSPNSRLEVKGLGFVADQPVPVSFDGEIISSPSANSQGSWSIDLFIPESPAGVYSVTVPSPGGELNAPFRVTPAIVLSGTHGEPGAPIDLPVLVLPPTRKVSRSL